MTIFSLQSGCLFYNLYFLLDEVNFFFFCSVVIKQSINYQNNHVVGRKGGEGGEMVVIEFKIIY